MSDTCAFSSEKYDIASILTIPTRELEPFGLSGLPLLMSSSSTVEPSRCATSHLAKPWTWVPYLRQRRSKASRQHWRVFSLKEIKTEEHCDPIGIRSGSVVQPLLLRSRTHCKRRRVIHPCSRTPPSYPRVLKTYRMQFTVSMHSTLSKNMAFILLPTPSPRP